MSNQDAKYKAYRAVLRSTAEARMDDKEIGIITRNKSLLWNDNGTFREVVDANYREAKSYQTLAAAISEIGSTAIDLELSTAVTLTGHLTIPSTMRLRIRRGGSIALAGFTLTINGDFSAGAYQVFSGTGSVVFGTPGETQVEWWYDGSGDHANAFNKALACRGDLGNRIIHPPRRVALIASTIQLGNSHVHWGGCSSSLLDEDVPTIKWNGAAGGTMFQTTAALQGVRIRDLVFDGGHKTKWCWSVDGLRKGCEVERIVWTRSVGFIYCTNGYYSSWVNCTARLQTPGTYIGGTGQVTLADWQAVCNSGFAAPVTFRSNANNLRLEKLSLSRVGCYEPPAGGSAIAQMVLLSGQNIHVILPTWEGVESTSVAPGPEDGDILGFSTGISGDGASQLSFLVLGGVESGNSDAHRLYWTLTNSGSTRTFSLYKDSAKTQLVARGSRSGDGIIILHPQGGSNLHGQVTVAYTGDDTDSANIIRWNYMATTRVLKIEAGSAISIEQAYLEACFAATLAEVSSIMRGALQFSKIYMEDCYFSGDLFESSNLHDIEIGQIVGIGVTMGGSYVSDNSTSTHLRIGRAELHNRFIAIGGVNYSDETIGKLGLAATSGHLPVIYRPKVTSGMTVTQGSDSNGDYILVNPGSIRDGLGRSLKIGRVETINSITAAVGWLLRPPAGVHDYNVCVDAAGMVFIEDQTALKASDEQGKIILATFGVDLTGAIIALTTVTSPRSTRGIETVNGGAVQMDGPLILTDDDEAQIIRVNTSDGADNKRVILAGGGDTSNTRGAAVTVRGNEHASNAGFIELNVGNVATAKLRIATQGTARHEVDHSGHLIHLTRVSWKKGLDVAAANDLTLPSADNGGNVFRVTGATQINGIASANWQAGPVILYFASTPTIKHNTAAGSGFASIKLQGSVDLVAAADTVLMLFFDGTHWQENSRKTP